MKLRLAEEPMLRVWVVEDDVDLAGSLIDALQGDGCDVLHAETGADTVRIALARSPHPVVLDLGRTDHLRLHRGLRV